MAFGGVWGSRLTRFGVPRTLRGPIFWGSTSLASPTKFDKISNQGAFAIAIVPFGRYLVPQVRCWPWRDARRVLISSVCVVFDIFRVCLFIPGAFPEFHRRGPGACRNFIEGVPELAGISSMWSRKFMDLPGLRVSRTLGRHRIRVGGPGNSSMWSQNFRDAGPGDHRSGPGILRDRFFDRRT